VVLLYYCIMTNALHTYVDCVMHCISVKIYGKWINMIWYDMIRWYRNVSSEWVDCVCLCLFVCDVIELWAVRALTGCVGFLSVLWYRNVNRERVVLYCTVLHCTLLYSTIIYCIVLYCTIVNCTVLHSTVLFCTILYCTVIYCTALYCTVL
jgi:hypothetical protein